MTTSDRPSVVIVDDHELFRQGLHALLDRDFRVTGSGGSGKDARTLSERLQPDLLILDVETGSEPAEAVIRTVRRSAPGVVIFVLTMHDDAILRRQLLSAGATDFATKAIDRRELIGRLRAAVRSGPAAVSRSQLAGESVLTQRELEVLRLVAAAASNRDIGRRLAISEGTVKRHLANIFAKLGAASRIDAVARARLHGLLQAPSDVV